MQPAFDFDFSRLPNFYVSVKVILKEEDGF